MAKREFDLKTEIRDYIKSLSDHINLKEVILFGSQLSGRADEYSDIDLAVVSPDFKGKSYEEIIDIFAELALKGNVRIEAHPYTEEDMKTARPTNFLGYLLKNGKVIFKQNKLNL